MQFGQKQVRINHGDGHKVQTEDSIMISLTILKHEWLDSWDLAKTATYKFLRSMPFLADSVLSMWGHSFRAQKQTCSAEICDSIQVHALIPVDRLLGVLKASGHNHVWIVPKTTDGRPDPQWKLIWLDDMDFQTASVMGAKTSQAVLFFPRSCLVVHATWSVIESEETKLTICMNLGEARFAGETVRRSYNLRSWITGSHQKQPEQGTTRHGTQAPPGQEPRDTGQKTTKPPTKEGGDPNSEWASLGKRIPTTRSRRLLTETQARKHLRSGLYTASCRIGRTTTGEKSLSHCHSNRCGHVGQRPSSLPLHLRYHQECQQIHWSARIIQRACRGYLL